MTHRRANNQTQIYTVKIEFVLKWYLAQSPKQRPGRAAARTQAPKAARTRRTREPRAQGPELTHGQRVENPVAPDGRPGVGSGVPTPECGWDPGFRNALNESQCEHSLPHLVPMCKLGGAMSRHPSSQCRKSRFHRDQHKKDAEFKTEHLRY